MKHPAFLALLLSPLWIDHAAAVTTKDLTFVPVDPCRIVDTRISAGGALPADVVGIDGDARHFKVAGTGPDLAVQGGAPEGCTHPKSGTGREPVAIAAYVVAVPAGTSSGGVLTAFPADQPDPPLGSSATVNYAAGETVGNSTIIPLCEVGDCPEDGQLGILSRFSPQHAVVDVQGYFYAPSLIGSYRIFTFGGHLHRDAETASVGFNSSVSPPAVLTFSSDGTFTFGATTTAVHDLQTDPSPDLATDEVDQGATAGNYTVTPAGIVTLSFPGEDTLVLYSTPNREVLFYNMQASDEENTATEMGIFLKID